MHIGDKRSITLGLYRERIMILNILPSDLDTEGITDYDCYVIFYAKLIGIDPISEPELLWIARAGLLLSLPSDRKGRLYYHDQQNKKSSCEHPTDSYYRTLVVPYNLYDIGIPIRLL
ncbi:hypothetical protein DERF_006549 [Dermatophagoides farinae]|uniref:Uncharacterized protein n=1 Tax=Dermatophagoides farinae TaxID=6954 RepID=A0A922I925_DERFA|nr:hypothetical protein DERF_006549 [Dermatophagoides farinae]